MDLGMFQKTRFGDLVPIAGSTAAGEAWEHRAFLPRPLQDFQPDLGQQAHLWVGEARGELASLDATAARLPNPRLFRTATLRLEAQSTAALEGTYEPRARVLAADNDESDPSLREVLNYLTAANAAYAWAEQCRPLSINDLCSLQAILMEGTRQQREFSGRVRPIQVVIGRRESASASELPIKAARYVPPPPGPDLEARLRDLLAWMRTDHRGSLDPVVAAGMGHYAFEALHPFHDGNGRLGRLLIVLQLLTSKTLSEPTLTVSPWFEARRAAYYDALLAVSTRGDWTGWITLFAQGLAESARETKHRMLRLVEVQLSLKDTLAETSLRSPNARILIDFAVGHPTFTVAQAAQALGMQPAGAKKLIDSLVDHDLLAPWGHRKYNRQFHAPAVMEVLLQA